MAAVAISFDVVIFKLFSERKTILNLILANFTRRSFPLTHFTEKKNALKERPSSTGVNQNLLSDFYVFICEGKLVAKEKIRWTVVIVEQNNIKGV